MKNIVFTLFTGLGIAAFAQSATAANMSPLGNWMLDNGRLKVKVTACQGDKLCANVIWMPDPSNADGTPKLDLKNKNPALRKRPLIGLPVVEGMTATGNNKWKGKIYSSDEGTSYRGYATLKGDKFTLQGCWLVICKDLNFNRSK